MATNVGINVAVTSTGTQQVTVQLQNIGGAATQSAQQVDTLSSAIKGLGLGIAIQQLQQYIDTWSNVEGMVRTATKSLDEASVVTQKIFEIAQNSRTPLQDVASVYQRIAIQSDALGLSQQNVLDITSTLSNALIVQHVSAQQASGALLQFSQALGTGKVRAQEWNSVLTQLPVLARAIAVELGVATSQVKAMITAGTLTSQGLADATLKAQSGIQKLADESAHTIAQSFTVLKNAVTQYVGELAGAVNASNTFGNAMKYLADNIQTVGRILIAAGAGLITYALLAGGLTTIVTALTTALTAMATALLANPFTAIAAAIVAASVALYEFRNDIVVSQQDGTTLGDYFVSAFGLVKTALSGTGTAIADFVAGVVNMFSQLGDDISANFGLAVPKFGDILKTLANLIIGFAVGSYNSFSEIWNNLPQYFVSVFVQAYNLAITATTEFVNQLIAASNLLGDKVGLHIDPAQATYITDTYKQVTDDVADAYKKAFNTDYVSNFMTALTAGAQQAAKIRQAIVPPTADLNQHGDPAEIVGKQKKGPKDTLPDQLRTLLNTIDPASGALLQMQKDTDILDKSLGRGLINLDQYDRYIVAMKLHFADILDPFAAYIRKLNEEDAALALDGDEKERFTKVSQEVEDLRKKSIVLSAQQVQALNDEIIANQRLTKEFNARASILANYKGVSDTYNYSLVAADQLYAKGAITAQQYADSVDSINEAYLDTQKTADAGFQSGLIQVFKDSQDAAGAAKTVVVDAFSGMNDALAKFVTTGKLSFGDLVSSIESDLAKLYLKVVENNILSSLFGSGTGLASAGSGLFSYLGGSASTSTGAGAVAAGFASGGYTGDGGANDQAGIVHKGEVVVNAGVVSQPGMKDYLTAINAGMPPTTVVPTNTGSSNAGATVNVQVTNNASDKVNATVTQGQDKNGSPNLSVLIDSVEEQLAGRMASGRGKLYKSVGSAYNLKNVPSRG